MSGASVFGRKFSRARAFGRVRSSSPHGNVFRFEDELEMGNASHTKIVPFRQRCLALLASSIVANHKPKVHDAVDDSDKDSMKTARFEEKPRADVQKKRKVEDEVFPVAPTRKELPAPAKPPPPSAMSPLMQSFRKKLDGARFRWINEQLYTQTGAASLEDIRKDPTIFDAVPCIVVMHFCSFVFTFVLR